ncbi:hypothetical protein FA15DRAFT_676493 [Coprinopsis marcescibilis]|uniref:Uncharacterized protein n=1 Tax=Coprinopsis marcescibilis TaxID=230819 RepID=A0A5C3KA59_COPMA|nr:hypothetical protein FA15DRAFT_676493 [Coprinopsis marcescibilis]
MCERPFDDLTPVLVNAVIKLLSTSSYSHFGGSNSRDWLGAKRSARAASSTTWSPPIAQQEGYCGHLDHVAVIKRPPSIFCNGLSITKIFNECTHSFVPFRPWIGVKYHKVYNAAWWPLHSVLRPAPALIHAQGSSPQGMPPRSSIASTGSATFVRPSERLSESWP